MYRPVPQKKCKLMRQDRQFIYTSTQKVIWLDTSWSTFTVLNILLCPVNSCLSGSPPDQLILFHYPIHPSFHTLEQRSRCIYTPNETYTCVKHDVVVCSLGIGGIRVKPFKIIRIQLPKWRWSVVAVPVRTRKGSIFVMVRKFVCWIGFPSSIVHVSITGCLDNHRWSTNLRLIL
jgi:hypothetical protein